MKYYPEANDARLCEICNEPIPERFRSNRKTCSAECHAIRQRAYHKGWIQSTEAGQTRYRRWRQQTVRAPDFDRHNRLRDRFKMTIEEYDARLAEQDGVCLVCRQPPKEAKRLVVDHDHRCCPGRRCCGRCVRGLLCSRCNLLIGHMEFVGVDALIKYLAA